MIKDISEKDKKDWDDFISSDEKLPDKDSSVKSKILVKTRSIDLHGLSLEKANIVIDEFINKAFIEKINKLIVITGKGIHSQNEKDPYVSKDLGILKNSVPEYILNNKNLMSMINEIQSAKIEDGGSGAFYIILKKK